MTLILDLPQDLEREPAAEAAELGLPLDEYALRLLYTRPFIGPELRTGSELVAYWQKVHVIGSRQDIADSQGYARQLREQVESRSRQWV